MRGVEPKEAAANSGSTVPRNESANRKRVDPEALLRRLEWTVIRRLDGLLQGDYRTLLRGFGLDLADLRECQTHDDVRYIDWNVTARLQVPHVREFQEDREIAAWFLLDLSGSVDFGSQNVRNGFQPRSCGARTPAHPAIASVRCSMATTRSSGARRRRRCHLLDRMLAWASTRTRACAQRAGQRRIWANADGRSR